MGGLRLTKQILIKLAQNVRQIGRFSQANRIEQVLTLGYQIVNSPSYDWTFRQQLIIMTCTHATSAASMLT
ncbi:hypothetical protein CRENPOLYSF1_430011 [Crenothrix polyspora]|uniref:Transposase n=1 Tax=Crenothrix polyspora TaxID=360316 RepID=A0A1R4HAK1_9GAMM|nr:hypothetical protein CRENPOLYSF1_430011 [Crenothrix polyspora]